MRILFCSVTYPPQLNGQAVFTQTIAEGLAGQGHRVTVLLPEGDAPAGRSEVNGVSLVRFPALDLTWVQQDLRVPFITRRAVRAVLDELRPDVVHIQDMSPMWHVVLNEARRRNVPVMMTHHTGPQVNAPYLVFKIDSLNRAAQWVIWKFIIAHLNRADLVTAPSRFSATMLAGQGLRVPLRTVPCGVTADGFTPPHGEEAGPAGRAAALRRYGLDPECSVFLYVGRLDPEKNVEVLLRALQALPRQDVQLAIAGDGVQAAHLHKLAADLDLGERARFLGWVERSRLPGLVAAADVFVMPGRGESFSIATLEAMACARPVLAADASALPELVQPGMNGALFDASNAAGAARGIEHLVGQRAQWPAMGAESRARAQRFNLGAVLHQLERAYAACHAAAGAALRRRSQPFSRRLGLFSPRALLVMLLLMVMFLSPLFYDQAQAVALLRLSEPAALEVKQPVQLLLISPNPDGELLAAGGLIRRVMEESGQVVVTLVTSADDLPNASLALNDRFQPLSDIAIDVGRFHQAETLAALGKIGIGPTEVNFLGYPAGRINDLWYGSWEYALFPPGAPMTGVKGNSAGRSFDRQVYAIGVELYTELLELMEEARPDTVLLLLPAGSPVPGPGSQLARFAVSGTFTAGENPAPLAWVCLVQPEACVLPPGAGSGRAPLRDQRPNRSPFD